MTGSKPSLPTIVVDFSRFFAREYDVLELSVIYFHFIFIPKCLDPRYFFKEIYSDKNYMLIVKMPLTSTSILESASEKDITLKFNDVQTRCIEAK